MSLPLSSSPFTIGVNLPWVNYGCDFGANAWHPDGGVSSAGPRETAARALDAIAGAGASVVRWFLLCDGRAGLRLDDRGRPTGLDDHVFRDMDTALGLASASGLRVMFVLFDFNWCHRVRRVNGVDLGGRRRLFADPDARHAMLDAVVEPLVARYGGHPAIWAWDVINEPEWVTLGLGTLNPTRAISRDAMRAFITETVGVIHEHATQPVTVGSASARWLSLVTTTGLDFYQVHWYDSLERRSPIDRAVAALSSDRPIVLGEFPTRGSKRAPADLFRLAMRHGYAGAFPWSWMADDKATDRGALEQAMAAARAG